MAPFRSSRSTRNNDSAAMNRGRGGIIDHDPTEGLPVRNWYLGNINVKQDEPSTNEDEQHTNINTSNLDYPWPELRLPTYFSDLPVVSQQLIRAARSGRSVKPSVYDKKTETYIPHAEYSARNVLKSRHLDNVDSPAADDDEEIDDDAVAKAGNELENKERAFGMKKWSQVSLAVAEKRPEPKYLADRRPGMRSLYGNFGVATTALNPVSGTTAAAAANYDLGDGSGLGNATGVLAAGTPAGEALTAAAAPLPAVKRMPPKRKRKKIGGPGRKKAYYGPGPERMTAANVTTPGLAGLGEGVAGSAQDGPEDGGSHPDTADAEGDEDADNHEDGSGSEEEGSEEGEIEENHPEMQVGDVPVVEAVVEVPAAPTTVIVEEDAAISTAAEPDVVPAPVAKIETTSPAVDLIEEVVVPVAPAPEKVDGTSTDANAEPAMEVDSAAMAEEAPIAIKEMKQEHQSEESKTKEVDLLGSLDGAIAGMEKSET